MRPLLGAVKGAIDGTNPVTCSDGRGSNSAASGFVGLPELSWESHCHRGTNVFARILLPALAHD